MDKPILEVIKTRRSVRKFKTDLIERNIIEDIIDAGRLAPSGMNEQPLEFVVVTDLDRRQQIADTCDYGKFIAVAPVCVLVLAKADATYYLEDGSAAIENILLAAWANGIASCWVAGDKKAYANAIREIAGAPANYRLVAALALGYSDDHTPRVPKRALDEVLHWEQFGQPE